ncbi:MAG TPA: GGDEF domain-containing protein [Pseudonocardiaceae bacterium]|nr:GGDEF domain-containing protein [Pseudonocardiaceae bacterium]
MDTTTVLATTTAVATAGWALTGGYADGLRQRLHTDPMTGIGNRAALTTLARRAARRGRWGGAVGVLMVDVDRFKAINDTWGHETGNTVLTAIAGRLAGLCRGSEVAIRLHGDEFALWLGALPTGPAGQQTAALRGQAVRAALVDPIDVATPDRVLRLAVSVSVGPAVLPGNGLQLAALLAAADRALYEAKRATYRTTPPLPTPPGHRLRDTRKDAA